MLHNFLLIEMTLIFLLFTAIFKKLIHKHKDEE